MLMHNLLIENIVCDSWLIKTTTIAHIRFITKPNLLALELAGEVVGMRELGTDTSGCWKAS